MKRLLPTVLVFCLSIAAVDAKIDAAKAKEGLVMVDGVFYVASKTAGKVLIGGRWVEPAGNRVFYDTCQAPATQAQWDQLWADMAVGGASVGDYLLAFGNDMYWAGDNAHISQMLRNLKTSGLSAARKQEIYANTYANAVISETQMAGNGSTFRDGCGVYDFSGWDISNVDFRGLMTTYFGDPSYFGSGDGQWKGVDLSNLGFTAAQLSTANLSGITLKGQDLTGLVTSADRATYLQLPGCNLTNADLRAAVVPGSWTDLRGCDLAGANLSGVDLSSVSLGCDETTGAFTSFSGVDMRGSTGYLYFESSSADFFGAKLYGSDLYTYDWATETWTQMDPYNTPQANWNP